MYLASLGIYVVGMLVTGFAVLSLAQGRRAMAWSATVACSLTLGAAATALIGFYLALAGVRPGETSLEVITGAALLTVVALVMRRKLKLPTERLDDDEPIEWVDLLAFLPMAAALYLCWPVWIQATHLPISVEWDGWAFWLMKAKVIAAEPLLPKPHLFTSAAFNYAHARYPLLWPMVAAQEFGLAATRDDHAARLVQLVLYAGFVLLVYTGLRWKLSRTPAAVLAALQAAVPSVIHYSAVGYTDVILAGFYAGMFYFVCRWVQTRDRSDLALAGAFTAGCAFTKNEGAALAVVSVVTVLAFALRRGWRAAATDTLTFAAIAFVPLLPWYIYAHGLPIDSEDIRHPFSFSLLFTNADRLALIRNSLWTEWKTWDHWGPLWPLLVIVAALGWRAFRSSAVAAGWVLLLAHFALYVAVYVVTPWRLETLLPLSLERLVIHTTPAAVLLIGWHWAAVGKARAAATLVP